MDVVALSLLVIAGILFFGFFAEFIFRRLKIPDVLFLIILGFVLGPHVLNVVTPADLLIIAPIFTTFALLFLLFDGAFNISLSSLVQEFSQSFGLTLFNFIISTLVVMIVMIIAGFSPLIALLTGFVLGGVSSSFVIPVLKQLRVSSKLYSLLTIESALTDVFCIVFSLTVIELITLGNFAVQNTLGSLAGLFAIAGLVGILAGLLWIVLILKVFKEHNYIMTIAYLLMVYVITEFLGGNGAIAALFFGIMLRNSKQLSSIIKGILSKKSSDKKKALRGKLGVSITTPSEEYFYHQISFFLKTFFFVYIGILIDLSDWRALVIGGVLSFLLLGSRFAAGLITRHEEKPARALTNAVFARGLAAAAVAQFAIQAAVPQAEFIAKITYVVITGTIILSSLHVFVVQKRYKQIAPLPKKKVVKE